jgi:hypothetical protein
MKAEKEDLLHSSGHAMAKYILSSSSAIFWDTDMSYGFQ